jgi:drug/metabolite transporter (DMT)-like permease
LGADWLTFARFAIAAPLLAIAGRRGLGNAFSLHTAAVGAVGFGAVIMLQNAGIERTSVSHAAVVVGVVPVLVALLAASMGQGRARRVSWGGYALALGGIALIAGTGGGGASPQGDLLVLGSAALSAAFIVIQPRLLAGRDAAAVTAVEFAAGALIALPLAMLTEAAPSTPADITPVLALVALALAGTLLPFWLFAYGQARVPAQLAGAYMNLEPVVGAAVGWTVFGSTAAMPQIAGALAVLAGIVLSTLPARHPEVA